MRLYPAHSSLALLFTLVLTTLAPQQAQAVPARYEIDSEHLSIGFLVEHIGYGKVLGMFRKASGHYDFDETTGALTNVDVSIDTASVFTNHEKRDEHLRGSDFLDSDEFPRMRFTADRARRTGERAFLVEGRLQLLGKTRPVTLRATWNKSAEYPLGDRAYVMGVSLRGSFERSAFGMTYAVANGWVGDEVELIIEFEARRR